MTPSVLAALVRARAEHRASVLATRLSDGVQVLFEDTAPVDDAAALPRADLRRLADAALAAEKSAVHELDGQAWFFHVHAPPFRLILVGAVHIAQALVPIARLLSLAVTIVDPRAGFNSADRFGDVARRLDWPDAALEALAPDARTAVVALSHDPKLDDPALDRALRSPALYVGALGSRRSQAARLARLAALGHGPAALERVRGPVGLALGAVAAPEIALSILAEIVAVRRGAALGQRP